jgi:hypothetical protein
MAANGWVILDLSTYSLGRRRSTVDDIMTAVCADACDWKRTQIPCGTGI